MLLGASLAVKGNLFSDGFTTCPNAGSRVSLGKSEKYERISEAYVKPVVGWRYSLDLRPKSS